MSGMTKRIASLAASVLLATTSALGAVSSITAGAAYGVGGNGTAIMEYLDRGIYAVKSGNGMFVSWRYNANDADNAEFRLYRDDKLIYTSKSGDATSYQDNGGSTNSKYRVDCISGGKVVNSQNCKFTSGSDYFDIKLNRPGNQYSPNDCCVGDVDGDGQYEIFLKWDPSNSKDNSQQGTTDDVIIDCYTLTGKQLWRINLGKNIRAGQHYTQMCVADFDCDGKAELITKTADGTKDGKGKVIGNASKDYRNGSGYILDGPEYMTLFDGQTGAALDTIDFPVPRGKVSDWGDNYGNRVDRMNSGIAYLDGVHPSAIYGRGYYTRLTWSAVDVRNKKLVKRWVYDSTFNKSTKGWGCGNHNVMVADCDNDGKQEIFTGASCIDDNGKLLWSTGNLHGDAMHVGDLIPDREGLEVWECHEDKPYGESCYDAKTGKTIFHINNTKDTGRCAADNVWAGSKGAEFWGAADGNVYNTTGKKIGGTKPAQNFFIYWDGDLEREILDGNKISKMTGADKIDRIFTANGCGSNNSSKSVPCMTVDLFGDWREELILRTDDNTKLRVWCTTNTTKVRLTTLMHDMQYRAQNCCQQSAYNQPPHVSYYLGSDAPLPARPKIKLNNDGGYTGGNTDPIIYDPVIPETHETDIIDGQIYTFKNVNSGLYLSVEGAAAANGANIEQGNANGKQVQFKAVSAGDGYFYLVSQLGDGKTYAIDVSGRHTEDETNIEIYEFNKGENQKFRIDKNSDGTYSILTKITNGNSALDVNGKSTNAGANVQQYTYKGSTNQKWYAEAVKQNNDNPTPQDPPVVQTSDITDGKIYTIKNLNSGLYLSVKGSNAGNGVNVEQAAANGAQNKFKAVAAGDGYFYLVSQLGDGNSYALDVNGKKTEDGTNIEIYTFNKGDNQKFKFVKNPDGTFSILTKITDGKSALDVNAQSRDAGANIQQYTYNGGNNQKWYVETAASGDISTGSYPVVTSIEYNATYHQFRMNWTPVKNAEKYGIAVYLAGKWRVQAYTNDTTFMSPKLKAGEKYKVLVAARVGGQWDLTDLKERAVIIDIK